MTPIRDARALHADAARLRAAGEQAWHRGGISAAKNAIAVVNMAEGLLERGSRPHALSQMRGDVALLLDAAAAGGAAPDWLDAVISLWRDATAWGE